MYSADVTAGINAVAGDHNNLRKDVILGTLIVSSDADATTITMDLSDTTKGKVRFITLGGNRTLALSNVTTGQAFVIRLTQDGSGSRTVTWFTTIKWPDNIVPTLTTTAGKTDVFGFLCTSAGNYDCISITQNL